MFLQVLESIGLGIVGLALFAAILTAMFCVTNTAAARNSFFAFAFSFLFFFALLFGAAIGTIFGGVIIWHA